MVCSVCHVDRPAVCDSCVSEIRRALVELSDAMAANAALPVRTAEEEAVIRAAVAVSRASKVGGLGYLGPPEDIEKTDALDDAVDALLEKQGEWGKP